MCFYTNRPTYEFTRLYIYIYIYIYTHTYSYLYLCPSACDSQWSLWSIFECFLHNVHFSVSVSSPPQVFRIQPPMCITREDADFFLAVFDRAIKNYMDRHWGSQKEWLDAEQPNLATRISIAREIFSNVINHFVACAFYFVELNFNS